MARNDPCLPQNHPVYTCTYQGSGPFSQLGNLVTRERGQGPRAGGGELSPVNLGRIRLDDWMSLLPWQPKKNRKWKEVDERVVDFGREWEVPELKRNFRWFRLLPESPKCFTTSIIKLWLWEWVYWKCFWLLLLLVISLSNLTSCGIYLEKAPTVR